MRLQKKIPNCWGCVFFDSAQTYTASRQNAFVYDGRASGQTIYTYVLNNPLYYTDPSGYSWWTSLRDGVIKPAIAFVAGTLACGGNAYCGAAAAGSVQGYDQTHNLQGMITGAANGLTSQWIGQNFSVGGTNGAPINWGNVLPNAGLHAARACAFSGGNCKEAAVSTFVSTSLGPITDNALSSGGIVLQIIGRGVVGGFASMAVGGTFDQGFKQGSFEAITNQFSGVLVAATFALAYDTAILHGAASRYMLNSMMNASSGTGNGDLDSALNVEGTSASGGAMPPDDDGSGNDSNYRQDKKLSSI